jgi:hypothetical protein
MRNTTTASSSSTGTGLDAYNDLPDHHYMSIPNLVITSPNKFYRDTDGEEYRYGYGYGRRAPQWDYSRLQDPDALRRFQSAVTYCLTCFDDSSEGDYDPSCECFIIVIGKGEGEVGRASDVAIRDNVAVTPPVGATLPPYDVAHATQIAQFHELEAKLNAKRE